jgi:Flp pilus assembly CpaF family ATPase
MSESLRKRRSEVERLLEKFRPFLASDDTFDVLVNPPRGADAGCTVWVDTTAGLRNTGLVLAPIEVANLNRSIASELGRYCDEEHPILMGELPWNGCRVTALNYPITRSGPALCLRKPSSRLLTLDDYVRTGALDGPAPSRKAAAPRPVRGHRAVIEYAVDHGLNVLIGGAPQSGKSTLLGAVQLVARQRRLDRRLFVLEDLEELNDAALPANVLRVQPCAELGITDSDLLQVGKRVRPDGIIVAELLRPQACYNFLASLNAGMDSSCTTIHARNAHDALVACETFIEQVPGIEVSSAMIAKAIDLVLYIVRTPTGRRITEVAFVNGSRGRGHYDLDYVDVDDDPNVRIHLSSSIENPFGERPLE